jgi:rare lipoprotein A (peptidoglycan hydrolase)
MPDFVKGQATYYGPGFQGNRTSQGDRFNTEEYSAAIQIDLRNKFGVPAGTKQLGYARVTNLDTRKSILVKLNDVGPLTSGRVIDLSQASFRSLSPTGTLGPGVLNNIKVEYLGQFKKGNPVGPTTTPSRKPTPPPPRPTISELEVQTYQESQEELPPPQESPAELDPLSPFYTDKGVKQLRKNVEVARDFIQSDAVELDNIIISAGPPQQSLLDRIEESGITPNLYNEFPQYADLISSYADKRESLQNLEKILENFLSDVEKTCPVTSELSNSWSNEEKKCRDGFNYSALRALEADIEKQLLDLPDPCGKSTLAGINNALLNFFDFLKGIKKYYNLYVQGTINRIQNLTSIIARTADIIASILKLLIQRVRNYILNLLRKLIEKVIDRILTSLSKNLKNAVIKAIVDSLICKFNEIIKGLRNLVVDFLFALIGNVINAPICAVEQFTNALINNLAVQTDRALAPILAGINDVLGGVAKIAGNVFQAIDFILGFESFLCAKPKCPQIKSWKASAGAGPTPAMEESFNNFFPIPNADQVEDAVLGKVDEFIGNALPDVGIFGDERLDGATLASGIRPPGVQCFPGAFRCGPPNVVFFGGGGVGAIGNAVINSIGEVVGVDLTYGGAGYTAPPFVTFQDNCGNGNNASGYTVINNVGEVVGVVMVNPGTGYLNNVSGTTEFEQIPQELITPAETTTREYVTCLDRIEIVNTGIGYLPTDSVSITPDLPGLQVKVQITEVGQIVSMEVLNSGCGFAEIPEITINSDTGAGLEVRPVMKFVERQQYLDEQPDFVPSRLIKVIDCVTK